MKESVNDLGYGYDDISCMTYDIHVDILLGYVFVVLSRPESGPDPIGGSEPSSTTRDSGLGLFT